MDSSAKYIYYYQFTIPTFMNMNGVTSAHCLVEVFPSATLPSPTPVLAMGRIE